MDIGRSFTYMFDDEKWVQKLAIGGLLALLSIIPIVNFFTILVIAGYSIRVLRRVAVNDPTPLPEWDDWGGDWVRGLMVVLAGVIYSLPAILVSGLSAIISGIASENGQTEVSGAWGICIAGLSCLSALWGILVYIVLPAAMINYAMEGELGSFFEFRKIFRFIGDNLSNYIIAILLIIVARIVAAFGVILCVIGVFFTSFWAMLVSSHLLGQVRREAGPVVGRMVPSSPTAGPTATTELPRTRIYPEPEPPAPEQPTEPPTPPQP